MKRVMIDYTYYQRGKYHGGGEYGNVVVRKLQSVEDIQFGIFYLDSLECRSDILEECAGLGWEIYSISDYRELPELLEQYRYNVLYSSLPYQPGREGVRLPDNVKYIMTYHGLRELELLDYIGILKGKHFGMRGSEEYQTLYDFYLSPLMAAQNRKIITDSRHSKYSLLQYFPFLKDNEIEVLYPPLKNVVNKITEQEDVILSEMGLKRLQYALMVSGGIHYKNSLRAAVAYDHFFQEQKVEMDYKVVIAGIDDPNSILNYVSCGERFLILPYMSDYLLEILYKNAHTFVFPSINEGFGYPPIEAMKYQVFCLCAADTAITEICGDLCLYFNPLFVGEIENRIIQSFSEDIRKEYIDRIGDGLEKINERQKRDLDRLVEIIIGD